MLVLRRIGVDATPAVFVLLTLFSCQYVKGDGKLYQGHAKLLDKLFLDYDKVSRPSENAVNVTLGIAVAQLVKVDEKMEGMNLNVWFRMAWNDVRLRWDPLEHENISSFKVDSDSLWTPDIMLNKPLTSDAGQILGIKKHEDDLAWKISVSSDGTAYFNFPGSIYGQCSLTISDYPYDEHKCSFVFSSWVHDGSELVLKLRPSNPLDFGNYVLNNEWHIVGTEPKAIAKKFECCPAPYYLTSFNIHVRRGASSYVSNYIIPSILIAILSIMMFTLPPEVGKRMEIGINLLLCLSVYLTILNTKMPTRSDAFPLLSKFYGCCIFILTCALLCTCWVVTYYFHDMSGWQIYSMSKFVEVGILKHLRRALRFPNATKVFPSDVLESVNSQRTIEVKPMTNEKTNFAGNPARGPDRVPVKPAKDKKKVANENDRVKPPEKQSSNVCKQPETESKQTVVKNKDPLPEHTRREKPVTTTKDSGTTDKKRNDDNPRKASVNDRMTDPVAGLSNNTDKKPATDSEQTAVKNKDPPPEYTKREKRVATTQGTDSSDKKLNDDNPRNEDENGKQIVKKRSKENLENMKLKENETSDNEVENAKKAEKNSKKKRKKRDKSRGDEFEAVKPKLKPLKEDKTEDTPRESDKTDNIRDSRSASRESNNSQTSKKSNNVFGDTLTQGLAGKPKKDRNRRKPKGKDLGVVNLGADNEDKKSGDKKQTEEKKESKEKKESEEKKEIDEKETGKSQKAIAVREAPSLKNKTVKHKEDEKANETGSTVPEKPALIGKAVVLPVLDQNFDAKQASDKKKHDSIKLLRELSAYFSDHLERKKNRYQWRQAAIVLNRLFLIILCISIAMSIILVFLAR